jgi:hypothetical protein
MLTIDRQNPSAGRSGRREIADPCQNTKRLRVTLVGWAPKAGDQAPLSLVFAKPAPRHRDETGPSGLDPKGTDLRDEFFRLSVAVTPNSFLQPKCSVPLTQHGTPIAGTDYSGARPVRQGCRQAVKPTAAHKGVKDRALIGWEDEFIGHVDHFRPRHLPQCWSRRPARGVRGTILGIGGSAASRANRDMFSIQRRYGKSRNGASSGSALPARSRHVNSGDRDKPYWSVRSREGHRLAWLYHEDEETRRSIMRRMRKSEA